MNNDLRQSSRDKRVEVLLAVFNGAEFLQSQIDTLARQTIDKIDVCASDDGSKDRSMMILEQAARDWTRGSFRIVEGPQQGFAENFRSLLTNTGNDADYFAFCDQDDLWEEDKLAEALKWLAAQDEGTPALFCSRTRTITIDGRDAGFSPLFGKAPSFRNAMVQSIAGANTMVMNRAAWKVVCEASRRASFVSHDWWCYLIVTGVGGLVHYSPTARIGYRQHATNLVGENNSWRARFSRISYLMNGRFVRWNDQNIAALTVCQDMLTPDALAVMRLFIKAREVGLFARITALLRSGVYRQTLFGQIGLYVACLLKKL
jgi:glycosyltransferase involved in cell wall biosynthesis